MSSDVDKLILLADYFDHLDRQAGNKDNHEVQDDLRRIANELQKDRFSTACMGLLIALYSQESRWTAEEFKQKAIDVIKRYMYN